MKHQRDSIPGVCDSIPGAITARMIAEYEATMVPMPTPTIQAKKKRRSKKAARRARQIERDKNTISNRLHDAVGKLRQRLNG